MTREEFELLQQRLQNSGLGIMKFLRSENINHPHIPNGNVDLAQKKMRRQRQNKP